MQPANYLWRLFGGLFLALILVLIISTLLNAPLAALAVGSTLIALIVKSHSSGIKEIQEAAKKFSEGQLDYRIPRLDHPELAPLGIAMNSLAAKMQRKVFAITSQRNELDAVLSSMIEGVIAVDCSERIIRTNEAAARFLDLDANEALGQTIHEAVRNSSFQELSSKVLSSGGFVEGEISLQNDGERFLQVHGNVLLSASGEQIGALYVLNDITNLRRLEIVRKDFVANVSHELKTPITSIKGFVETLQDDSTIDVDGKKHFLQIISRQTDRLNNIIDDLLTLSKIEREREDVSIRLQIAELSPIVRSAVLLCENAASKKGVTLSADSLSSTSALVNPPLLEQAITNLLSNAIKYSEEKSKVVIDITEEKNEVVVSVTDSGCGIEDSHIPRLFERFYRIDRARSREEGGTGLGLAIVKHIAQAHGGYPSIKSIPGQGSTFSLHLQSGAKV